MFRSAVAPSLAFAVLAAAGVCAMGQRGDNTYYIEGSVVDPSGNPIKHARLVLATYTFTRQNTTFSNDDGRFMFDRLTEGNYKLEVLASGWANYQESISLFSTSRNLRIVLVSASKDETTPGTPETVVSTSTLAVPGKAREEYEKALQAEKRGDLKSANSHLDKALQLYPDYAAAVATRGFLLLDEKKPGEAEVAFRKALQIEPDLSDALLGLGRIRNGESRFAEAETNLLQARAVNPDAWQVNYELGRACAGLKRDTEAELYLRKARAAAPAYPPVYYLLAQVLLRLDRPFEAVPEMEAYLRIVPDGPTADKVRDLIKRIESSKTRQ